MFHKLLAVQHRSNGLFSHLHLGGVRSAVLQSLIVNTRRIILDRLSIDHLQASKVLTPCINFKRRLLTIHYEH